MTSHRKDCEAPGAACKPAPLRPHRSEHGLSAVEALVALVVLSLVLLIGARMLSVQTALGGRAAAVAEDAVFEPFGVGLFQGVLGGALPSWPEEGHVFEGDASVLGGLTDRPLHAERRRVAPFALTVRRAGSGSTVIYRSGPSQLVLGRLEGRDATFSYLGADGTWHEGWPPASNPATGPYGEAALFDTPQLPMAIRLQTDRQAWIAALPNQRPLPARVQDL